jgi:HlyD family secretion protein
MTLHRLLRLAALTVLLSGCQRTPPSGWQGYAEGEYLSLAAPVAGYLATLDAPRGQRLAAGALAFTLARDPDREAADGADARVDSANRHLQNLATPRRHSEIEALEANVRAARAARVYADADFARIEALAARRLVAQEALDESRSRRDAAVASVAAAEATLATATETYGRTAEVAGARSDLAAARADAAEKHWALSQKSVTTPEAGEIADTYYRPGEWVTAGAPVASLLPDGRRRVRFFVPEMQVAHLHPGSRVTVRCDGCPHPLAATVDYIAPNAEYTPPVIYSRDSRSRLVFRVEAAPATADAPLLRPGLPLDVSPES